MTQKKKRRWVGPAVLGFVIFAVTMATISFVLMSRWSDLVEATPAEAEAAFAAARIQAGESPPYVEISPSGGVQVRRELEGEASVSLSTLSLLAWEPDGRNLVRIAFPYWFVRLKMSKTLNLGTMTSALAGDWANLDLRVTEDDLERLGPGLVLDHSRPDGARIMLWTE